MKTDSRDYLLLEYAHLRDEVLAALKDVAVNEKLALVISGSYWAWLATKSEYAGPATIIAWIPSCLVILFFLRWRALEQKFATVGGYLLRIEQAFELDGLGWEHHLKVVGKHWFRFHGWLFWFLLLIGNTVVGYFWSLRAVSPAV